MKKNLFVPSKGEYVRGKRPTVDCILCSIIQNDPKREYKKYAEELLDS